VTVKALLAALPSGKLPSLAGKRVVLPLTGGNIDAEVHARVVGEWRLREREAA